MISMLKKKTFFRIKCCHYFVIWTFFSTLSRMLMKNHSHIKCINIKWNQGNPIKLKGRRKKHKLNTLIRIHHIYRIDIIIIDLCWWNCFIGFYWVFFSFLFLILCCFISFCLSSLSPLPHHHSVFRHFHFWFYPILTFPFPFYCSIYVSIEGIDDAIRSYNNKRNFYSLILIILY